MKRQCPQLPTAAIEAADRGNLIEAVKITREKTGMGLKEAKEAVDAHLGRPRGHRSRHSDESNLAGDHLKRPVLFVLVAALLAVIVYSLRS